MELVVEEQHITITQDLIRRKIMDMELEAETKATLILRAQTEL